MKMKIEIKLSDGTYNKAVYFPAGLQYILSKTMETRYKITSTRHADEKIKICHLSPNIYKTALYGEVIEVEVKDCQIVKVITRLPSLFDNVDICSAVAINGTEARVKTVWTNDRFDNHYTLRTENYVKSKNKS